ncbi:MAG: hypothetical protein BMS9Abin05_0062 [Rhodothermia bacterium]|nr:MAG: hypothetical protein BMS9Abin05_0062 [Rhodothermia bacterium]
MRIVRILVFLIGFSLMASAPANAQIGGLLKRAKKKAEETLKKKADEEVDRQVDRQIEKLVSGLWDEAADQFGQMLLSALPKSKTTIDLEKGIIMQEGKDDIDIRDNDAKPTDAEYVSYIEVSTMNLPSQLSQVADMFGSVSINQVYLNGDLKLSGDAEAATLTDLATERFVNINHETEEFWAQGFTEMFEMAKGAVDNINARMEEVPELTPSETRDQPTYEMETKVSVKKGKRKKIRGIRAQQNIVIVETVQKSAETDEQQGKFYMITDLWTAEDFGGSETLAAYDQRLGEIMFESLTGSSLNEKLDFSAFGDPRMAESLAKATEILSEIKGTPIETNSYFVSGPIDEKLDLDAVLNGEGETDVRSFSGVSNDEPVKAQATMFSTTTFITNLSTDRFDLALLNPHATYEEIESPIKQFLETDGDN